MNKKMKMSMKSMIYIIAIAVIIVPLLLLGIIFLSTKEKSGSPTFGDRYKTSLDPAITTEQITELEGLLVYEDVETVEVNLKSKSWSNAIE
jgi:flagellar basal body-associated protein FliL